MTRTHDYAPGRLLEVHGDGGRGTVLLWHGRGVDQRTAMRPLARRLADLGVETVAVDWSSEAEDGGRSDLLTSVRWARERAERRGQDPGALVITGWSLGGTAALSLASHAKRLGIELGAVVAIAPGDGPRAIEPVSGHPLPERFAPGEGRCPVHLAYGADDPISTPDLVSGLELRLRVAGWRTTLHELRTDHAGIVGTRFDEVRETYPASGAAHAVTAVAQVATVVAETV